jgi:hypothetical protein
MTIVLPSRSSVKSTCWLGDASMRFTTLVTWLAAASTW